ncbi:MAG TPA: hypothetical protein VIO13_09860, partial [Candidatus Dormibacteraeota bacterium]
MSEARSGNLTPRTGARGVVAGVWLVWALIVLLSAADVLLQILDGGRDTSAGFGIPGTGIVGPLVFASVGVLISSRQRRNAVGWIFIAAGFSWAVATASQEYAVRT